MREHLNLFLLLLSPRSTFFPLLRFLDKVTPTAIPASPCLTFVLMCLNVNFQETPELLVPLTSGINQLSGFSVRRVKL